MKPGRNNPCPCGSGKKYKHCCLIAEAAPPAGPADLTWHRLRAQLDGYGTEMLHFTNQTYGPSALLEAWDAFTGFDGIAFDPDTPLIQLFMPWFFHFWTPDPEDTGVVQASLHDVIPTAAYLSAKGRRLDPLVRRYLQSLLTAPLTFFEVLACDPGICMTLRDVMTQEEHAVTERGLSQNMQPGDLLFGQLACVDQLTMIEAFNGFAIPPLEKAPVIALRARIAASCPVITHQILRDWDFELLGLFHDIADRLYNPQPPILQNTDGEPIVLCKLVFDLKNSPQTAFDALKHLALEEMREDLLEDAARDSEGNLTGVRFSWNKRGNNKHAGWDNTILGWIEIDGARLTAEVNSEARADRIRKAIKTALGKDVRYRASEIQSTDRMLADLRAAGDAGADEQERLNDSPEVREKISDMMAAHWEHWVDQPIPMLGNRTPMEAVKHPDGREIVESIIMQAERTADAATPQADAEVFHRLRQRLGLPRSRNASASGGRLKRRR